MPALKSAEKSGRPVHFIPYAKIEHLGIEAGSEPFLPRVGIKSLVRRNIKRFRETGRFIPTKAIIETASRVDQMMIQSMNEMQKLDQNRRRRAFTKFDLDVAIANLAGFRMGHDRTVQRSNAFNQSGPRRQGGRALLPPNRSGEKSVRGIRGRGRGRGRDTLRGGRTNLGKGRYRSDFNRQRGRGRSQGGRGTSSRGEQRWDAFRNVEEK